MECTETNSSLLNKSLDNLSTLSKPVKLKRRSQLERELETSLTSKITSPASSNEGAIRKSRYGRAQYDTEQGNPIYIKIPSEEIKPSNNTSEAIPETSGAKTKYVQKDLQQEVSLTNNDLSPVQKEYVRKDLIQSKEKRNTHNSHLKNILERSEKYENKVLSHNGYDTSSVKKSLDFDCTKKKKVEELKPTMSKSDQFNIEANCMYQVGHLAWARVGSYPYWPCIITREPSTGIFVKRKLFGRVERDVIHVTFFADNGRRGWVVENMLRKYSGIQEFENTRDQFSAEAKKKDPKLYAAFFISEKKQGIWDIAVQEAEALFGEPKRIRIDLLNDMLSLKTIIRKQKSRASRTDSDVSLSESLYDTLFSEDDGKGEESEKSKKHSRKTSLDVSEVVTACLDNMAAKTGISKIQRQSHMDIWLQKAKSKTPEKGPNPLKNITKSLQKNQRSAIKVTPKKFATRTPMKQANGFLNLPLKNINSSDGDGNEEAAVCGIGFITRVESLAVEAPLNGHCDSKVQITDNGRSKRSNPLARNCYAGAKRSKDTNKDKEAFIDVFSKNQHKSEINLALTPSDDTNKSKINNVSKNHQVHDQIHQSHKDLTKGTNSDITMTENNAEIGKMTNVVEIENTKKNFNKADSEKMEASDTNETAVLVETKTSPTFTESSPELSLESQAVMDNLDTEMAVTLIDNSIAQNKINKSSQHKLLDKNCELGQLKLRANQRIPTDIHQDLVSNEIHNNNAEEKFETPKNNYTRLQKKTKGIANDSPINSATIESNLKITCEEKLMQKTEQMSTNAANSDSSILNPSISSNMVENSVDYEDDNIKPKDKKKSVPKNNTNLEIQKPKKKLKMRSKIDKVPRYDKDFIEYVDLKIDSMLEEHPLLSKEDTISYLYKIWQYEQNLKSDTVKRGIASDSPIINQKHSAISELKHKKNSKRNTDVLTNGDKLSGGPLNNENADENVEATCVSPLVNMCEKSDSEEQFSKSKRKLRIQRTESANLKSVKKSPTTNKIAKYFSSSLNVRSSKSTEMNAETNLGTDLNSSNEVTSGNQNEKSGLNYKQAVEANLDTDLNSQIEATSGIQSDKSDALETNQTTEKSGLNDEKYKQAVEINMDTGLNSPNEATLENQIEKSGLNDNESKECEDKINLPASNDTSSLLADESFSKYVDLNMDKMLDEHPELPEKEIIEYLHKTWQYDHNLKISATQICADFPCTNNQNQISSDGKPSQQSEEQNSVNNPKSIDSKAINECEASLEKTIPETTECLKRDTTLNELQSPSTSSIETNTETKINSEDIESHINPNGIIENQKIRKSFRKLRLKSKISDSQMFSEHKTSEIVAKYIDTKKDNFQTAKINTSIECNRNTKTADLNPSIDEKTVTDKNIGLVSGTVENFQNNNIGCEPIKRKQLLLNRLELTKHDYWAKKGFVEYVDLKLDSVIDEIEKIQSDKEIIEYFFKSWQCEENSNVNVLETDNSSHTKRTKESSPHKIKKKLKNNESVDQNYDLKSLKIIIKKVPVPETEVPVNEQTTKECSDSNSNSSDSDVKNSPDKLKDKNKKQKSTYVIEKKQQTVNGKDDPEFIKYLELKQDEIMDENPHLCFEEIVNYLYKTWIYEQNMKSEYERNDEIAHSNIIKGFGDEPLQQPKKHKKRVKQEKHSSLDYEIIPKEKPKRKIAEAYYNENDTDFEDDLKVYEIFNIKPKSKQKDTAQNSIKTEEKIVIENDHNKDIALVNTEVPGDPVTEEVESYDEVEYYFSQLTKPKPNLFKGLARERVCEICEKTGNLVKCKGPCAGTYHLDCAKTKTKTESATPSSRGRKKKKQRGRKPKSLEDSGSQEEEMQIESHLVIDADNFETELERKMKELLEADTNVEYDSSYSSDDELKWNNSVAGKCEIVDVKLKVKSESDISDFKCDNCVKYETPICYVCKKERSPKNDAELRQRCQVAHCHKYYHMECLDHWPQTQFNSGEPSKNAKNILERFEAFSCPRHVCHTCVSDDPRGCKTRFSGDKLARCIRCPATYHSFTKCLPAGTTILSGAFIICPRHYEHRPGKVPCHVNTGWCFICALGGTLICCEYCPTSFHAECLNIKPPEGNYMCEDCETGRLPLYGEMVWVKLGHYRWWPGLILHPNEIPENIWGVKHSQGEFVVRFFGQYDHYWVNRGRVFPFQEGDSGRVSAQKSKIDEAFSLAIEHAQRACQIIKSSANQEEDADITSSLLPPAYVKLKSNKPCGSLANKRCDDERNSLTMCECNPNVESPCDFDSQCLNRMLLTECGPTCAAGDRCMNRAFEKRQYPKLVPYRTPYRGWGLKTLEDIRQGQFVIEYVGELIDEEEFRRRMDRMHEVRDENFYFLTLDKDRMIDAGPKGNLARFMNHSCEPNCETQKWTVLGDVRVGLFAMYDIPANSEVTFNYNLESAGIEKKQCLCGAKRCSGYIGAKPKQEEKETQPKKSKLTAKRTYKKRKPLPDSPSVSQPKTKPKTQRIKPKELTEIEKDLMIIKQAVNGLSSDSECSERILSEDKKALKRRRASLSSEDVYDSSSPSVKRMKSDDSDFKI